MEWQLVLVFMVWRDEDWKECWYLWYGKKRIGGGISVYGGRSGGSV
jgi:hypothetical protein